MATGVSLGVFVRRRLGAGSWWSQTVRVLVAPFLAPSLSAFWSSWNPVWYWCLHRWCYRPLRRRVPRGLAVMATFLVSGMAHNVLAVALSGRLSAFPTLWFACAGVLVVVTESLGWTYTRLPRPARPVLVLAHLWLSYDAAGLLCQV